MGCQATLDFAAPPATGAHLSFYWTMDEGGTADKVDSAAGLHWPLLTGTSAAPGLFSNGTEIADKIRGLKLINSPSVVVNQASSNGISWWFWVKVVAYGPNNVFCLLDTSGAGFNDLELTVLSIDASNTILDLTHNNGVDLPEATSASLSWSLGSWHMVASTYDKVAQTLNIYADSILVATAVDNFIYPDLLTSIWGLLTANPVGAMPDMIFDELGLCLTGALTQSQITALYNGGAGLTWPNITPIVPFP